MYIGDYRAYCQVVLDSTQDSVITVEADGAIYSANHATETVLGYSPSELIGQPISRLLTEPFRIAEGRRTLCRRKDGSACPVNLAVSAITLHGRAMATAFIRDLSSVIALENELRRQEIEFVIREERLRRSVVEEERKFLSRELHDSVSQALFGIVLGTQAALNSVTDAARVREALDYVLTLAEGGLAEMRALILELRPESLESEGLTGSLARQVKAASRRYSLELCLEIGEEPQVPLDLKQHCYRLVTEAVHNVVKHAQARRLSVRVRAAGAQVLLEVEDNGVGFDLESVPPNRFGLHSMRERAALAGGTVSISSELGVGTRVRALLGRREPEEIGPAMSQA